MNDVRASEVFDESDDGFLILDRGFRVVYVNRATVAARGQEAREVEGRVAWEVFPELIGTDLEASLRAAMQGRNPVRVEWRNPRGNRCIEACLTPVRDGLACLWRDVTGQRLLETALRESREAVERERDVLQAVMDGARTTLLAYLDRDFRFVRVNAAYAAGARRRPEELIGQDHFALFPHAENQAIFTRVRDTGEPFEVRDKPFEYPDQPDRGVTYWDWTLTPVKDSSGAVQGLVLSLVETTARKRGEEALTRLARTLEARVQERTAEVESLAHDLRELASELTRAEHRERQRLARLLHDHIQQLLVAARLQVGLLAGRQADAFGQAASRLAGDLLDQALSASRSLTTELSPPVLFEAGLGQALHWLARDVAEKHGFKVQLTIDPGVGPLPEDLRVFLFDAVRELLLNAVKHSGVADARVDLVRAEGGGIRVIVADEGRGFDPSVHRQAHGGGFGLFSIVQRTQHLGGRVEIVSGPGRGTRITLSTPPHSGPPFQLRDDAEAPRVARRQRQATAPAQHGPIRVVLADDHPLMRQGLATLLAGETGIEIVGEAANGAEAVELARTRRPDVIVMDISMPVMGGIDATRAITRELPSVQVIGLSMHEEAEMAAAIRAAGAVDYVTKGGPPEALVTAVRRAAQARRGATARPAGGQPGDRAR